MKKKLVFKNLLILACLIIFSQKSHPMQHITIDYPKMFQTGTAFAAGLGVFALSTIIHECGHAFMAKILLNSPFNVNIGGYSKPRAKIGPFGLSGYNPFVGYAKSDLKNSKKIDRILIDLAGPISGIISSLCLSKLHDNRDYKLACFLAFVGNINNLYPHFLDASGTNPLKSDGGSILEECINKELANKITTVLSNTIIKNVSLISFNALIFLAFQKSNFF